MNDRPSPIVDPVTTHAPVESVRPLSVWSFVWFGLGAVLMFVGAREATSAGRDLYWRDLAQWAVGGALVHDLIAAPVVVLVGRIIGNMFPNRYGTALKIGLILSAVMVLFAYPLLRAFGRRRDNSSTLPLNYAHSVWVLLGLVWLGMLG